MQSPNTFEQKKSFILAHPELIIKKASLYHPFSNVDLRKYRSILDWEGVVGNIYIPWSEAIIKEFKTEVFFDKKEYYRNPLHTNAALPWSIPFIERYQDLWRWEELAVNEIVTQDAEMRAFFAAKLLPPLFDIFPMSKRDEEDFQSDIIISLVQKVTITSQFRS